MEEYFFHCPACSERISILVDVSEEDGTQTFIEDCEVCCRAIQFQVMIANGAVEQFSCDVS